MGFLGEQASGKGGDDQTQMGCWWDEVVMKWNLWALCSVLALSLSTTPAHPHLIPTYQGKCNFSASLYVNKSR